MDEKDIEKRMQEAWNGHAPQKPQQDKDALWQNFAAETFPVQQKRYKKWLYPAVAAVLVLSLSISAFIYISNSQPATGTLAYTIIENPSEAIKVVTLLDSSVVELEPEAEIRYGENFAANRKIKLTGKAFFSVHKDKQHPFKVQCGETTTTVLGTCFTVDGATENTVQVNLYEGRVQMNVKGNNSNWILAPGEQFVYRNRNVSVEAFNRFRDFDNTEVSVVLGYIKATYGYTVQMPEGYPEMKITLRINRKEKLQNVVGIIAQMYDLKPTIDEKQKKVTLQ